MIENFYTNTLKYQVTVLGGGAVGKSALTIRLVTDNFLAEYDATIEDFHKKYIMVDDVPVTLNILDTAGQDEYKSMQDQWIREGAGFLLVYSITDASSFQKMADFREKVIRSKNSLHKVNVVCVCMCVRAREGAMLYYICCM